MNIDQETEIALLFKEVLHLANVESVSGGLVPVPPAGNTKGDYLFINCVYNLPNDLSDENKILAFRRDARRILEMAVARVCCNGLLAVCVSFYAIIEKGANIRLYRTSVNAKNLPKLRTDDFRCVTSGEESSLREVHTLLQMDRHNL